MDITIKIAILRHACARSRGRQMFNLQLCRDACDPRVREAIESLPLRAIARVAELVNARV